MSNIIPHPRRDMKREREIRDTPEANALEEAIHNMSRANTRLQPSPGEVKSQKPA